MHNIILYLFSDWEKKDRKEKFVMFVTLLNKFQNRIRFFVVCVENVLFDSIGKSNGGRKSFADSVEVAACVHWCSIEKFSDANFGGGNIVILYLNSV